MALAAIDLKNIKIAFSKQLILQDVSLEIQKSEVAVFVGPSGKGKSTLLKLMAGLLVPDTGSIKINGHDLSKISGTRRQEIINKMGMLFQKNALFDSLTCKENIAFPLREVTNKSAEDINATVDFFLQAVGLEQAKDLFPEEISGGMQKRLGIARALAQQPEIIFYDDPTAGLDPITSRKIIELIQLMHKKHESTIVAVTNDMQRAYQLADRIFMVIDHGVIETGTPEQTKRHSDARVKQFINGNLQGPLTELSEMQ